MAEVPSFLCCLAMVPPTEARFLWWWFPNFHDDKGIIGNGREPLYTSQTAGKEWCWIAPRFNHKRCADVFWSGWGWNILRLSSSRCHAILLAGGLQQFTIIYDCHCTVAWCHLCQLMLIGLWSSKCHATMPFTSSCPHNPRNLFILGAKLKPTVFSNPATTLLPFVSLLSLTSCVFKSKPLLT